MLHKAKRYHGPFDDSAVSGTTGVGHNKMEEGKWPESFPDSSARSGHYCDRQAEEVQQEKKGSRFEKED